MEVGSDGFPFQCFVFFLGSMLVFSGVSPFILSRRIHMYGTYLLLLVDLYGKCRQFFGGFINRAFVCEPFMEFTVNQCSWQDTK